MSDKWISIKDHKPQVVQRIFYKTEVDDTATLQLDIYSGREDDLGGSEYWCSAELDSGPYIPYPFDS